MSAKHKRHTGQPLKLADLREFVGQWVYVRHYPAQNAAYVGWTRRAAARSEHHLRQTASPCYPLRCSACLVTWHDFGHDQVAALEFERYEYDRLNAACVTMLNPYRPRGYWGENESLRRDWNRGYA